MMESVTVFCVSCGKEFLVFPLGSSTEIRPVLCQCCEEKTERSESSSDDGIDVKAILEEEEWNS